MKYLYFKTKGIAIPLAALQACADLRFLGSDYVTDKETGKSKYIYFDDDMSDYYARESIVIDESQILASCPKEAE